MSLTENSVNSRTKPLLLSAFGASLALHGVAYASLIDRHVDLPAPAVISTVSFDLSTKALPDPPAPARLPAPPLESNTAPVRALSKAPLAATAASPAAPAPKAAAPVLDLSGVTLTNDSQTGFAMPLGNGNTLHGPIGSGSAHASPGASASTPRARGGIAPLLVAARDLSEHPRPPALAALLRANYPDEARRRGLGGSASVRARIDPDGLIRSARLVSESTPGFGAACQRTVLGSRWSVPRTRNGDAVATEIVYTCHFEVDG